MLNLAELIVYPDTKRLEATRRRVDAGPNPDRVDRLKTPRNAVRVFVPGGGVVIAPSSGLVGPGSVIAVRGPVQAARERVVTSRQMLGMWDAATGTHLRLPMSQLTTGGANGAAILVQTGKDGLPGAILGAASLQL